MAYKYYYLRGRLGTAPRLASGEPGAITYLGDTTDLELKIASEKLTNKNNNGPISVTDLRVTHVLGGEFTLKVKSIDIAMLAKAVYGSVVTEAGGAFAATAFPPGLVVGGTYRIPGNRANLSALTIKDGSGSPVTLTLNTHYTQDLVNGTITIVSLTAGGVKVQPLTAEGTEVVGQQSVVLMNQRAQELYLFLEGINIAANDEPVIVDIYRAAFDPTDSLMLKGTGNDPQELSLAGEILADPTKTDASTFGRYGRYRILTPAS